MKREAESIGIALIFLLLPFSIFNVGTHGTHQDFSFTQDSKNVASIEWDDFQLFARQNEFGNRFLAYSQDTLVCGYVTDEISNEPIENATVYIIQNYTISNVTTDENGFYSMNVAAGKITIYCNAIGYYLKYVGEYEIKEHEILWVNISMERTSPQNSTVCGYVKNATTDEPIKNAMVSLYWEDASNRTIWNYTYTDENGFYAMHIPAGEIIVAVDATGYFYNYSERYYIGNNETLWINFSLVPQPPKNSVVCGYVKDVTTNEPIEGVRIHLHWRDEMGHYDWNYTYTDKKGFYSMKVATGIIYLSFYIDGYFEEYTENYEIGKNEILWINLSLYPLPPENSIICGYVKDEVSNEPIEKARISVDWEDGMGHYYWNYTYTDENGFYTINVAAGKAYLSFYADKYFSKEGGIFIIEENETLWVNVSLYPCPPENSTICGYVTDALTNEPIKEATVSLSWEDSMGHDKYNHTYTDENGFYSMKVASGKVYLSFFADGYFSGHAGWFYITAGETIWINISLYPHPPENSIICGYVKDASTGEPIKNVFISLTWKDDKGNHDSNFTYTDENGFYTINVAAGEIKLRFSASHYFSEDTEYFSVSENEKVWINSSLHPHPPENSIICGYVRNAITNETIEGVIVDINWEDDMGHREWNYTLTDENGFYAINVAEGEICLYFYADGYFGEYIEKYRIGKNETLWVNVTLYPIPPANSVICGYVKDETTNEPIKKASISVYWEDERGHSLYYHTTSDENGFYTINVAAGKISFYFWADCYYGEYMKNYTIGENETMWLNVTLEKGEIGIKIVKPYRGIYINNRKILPSLITVVIGKIDVEVSVLGPAWDDYVEFYVDDELRYTAFYYPYNWTWDERAFFRHELEVILHTKTGKTVEDSIKVWIFNL